MNRKHILQPTQTNMLNEADVLEAMREFDTYLDISPDDFRAIYTKAYNKARSRLFDTVTAANIMSHPVITIPDTMTVREAVDFLDEHTISGAPVTNAAQKLVGILSETDISRIAGGTKRPSPMHLLRAVLRKTFSQQSLDVSVASIMTKDVVCVEPKTSLAQMLACIQEKNINRLPVTDSSGKLLGLVSRTDLLNTLSSFTSLLPTGFSCNS